LGLTTYRLLSRLNAAQVAALQGKPVVAFAGLAHPQAFFEQLKHAGLNVVVSQPYPDHHRYRAADIQSLKALAAQHRATLVCTEKDAVKLPPGLATALELELVGDDWTNLLASLDTLLA
jgi:tetraacyldisaccharide 4'-kinase